METLRKIISYTHNWQKLRGWLYHATHQTGNCGGFVAAVYRSGRPGVTAMEVPLPVAVFSVKLPQNAFCTRYTSSPFSLLLCFSVWLKLLRQSGDFSDPRKLTLTTVLSVLIQISPSTISDEFWELILDESSKPAAFLRNGAHQKLFQLCSHVKNILVASLASIDFAPHSQVAHIDDSTSSRSPWRRLIHLTKGIWKPDLTAGRWKRHLHCKLSQPWRWRVI